MVTAGRHFVMLVIVVLTGCNKKVKEQQPKDAGAAPVLSNTKAAPLDADDRESMLDAMTRFTDRMCACTDRPCVETTNSEMTQWTVEFSRIATKTTSAPTPDQETRIAEIGQRYNDCSAKILAAHPAPDAAPPATPPKDLPPACVKFKAAVSAFASCDKMTTPIRNNLFQAADAIEMTEKSCTDGLAEIKEPADRMGCTLP